MKNYILIIAVLLFIGCKQDDTQVPPTIEGSHIAIDELITFLPTEYANEATSVYVNSNGDIKRLSIKYKNGVAQNNLNGMNYTSDQIEATLYTPLDPTSFQIVVAASANYDLGNSEEIFKGITTILMPFHPDGSTTLIIRFANGAPQKDSNYLGSTEILGKSFNDVFNIAFSQLEAYSELSVNSAVGVVSFRDGSDDLWVFDHFE